MERIYNHNLAYIGELFALRAWYYCIRPLFIEDELSRALISGLKENLDDCIRERIKRFTALGEKLAVSKDLISDASKGRGHPAGAIHEKVIQRLEAAGPVFDALMAILPDTMEAESFIREVEAGITRQGKDYVRVIQGLSQEAALTGTKWLSGIAWAAVSSLEL